MLQINPSEIPTPQFHAYMLGAIAPRPIAWVSSIDENGNVNLSPFSFFNAIGSNPPIVVFSPARRVRDNTTKHTLENARETQEIVINMVNYSLVEQMSLSSTEYPKSVNEFVKAGLTPIPSVKVKPPRVAESPVQMECKVLKIMETGYEGGAGNLVICEILLMHLAPEILNSNGQIDPHKIDLVARMGADFYCRASGAAVFEVEKPNTKIGMGIDQLPAHIRESTVLTGNNLAKLANFTQIPTQEILEKIELPQAFLSGNSHEIAKKLLDNQMILEAWKVLLG